MTGGDEAAAGSAGPAQGGGRAPGAPRPTGDARLRPGAGPDGEGPPVERPGHVASRGAGGRAGPPPSGERRGHPERHRLPRRDQDGSPEAPGALPPRHGRWRAPVATRSNALHAGAWWLWALGLAAAATRTTNPLLLGLIIAVAGYVVAARRTDAPWARAFSFFLALGAAVVVIRVLFALLVGSSVGGATVLFTLPEVPLPEWMQGVRIGGRVLAEGLLFAFYDGLRLATLLICVGAANALANPVRLLKSLPGALYEAGVAVVVAMTFAPRLITDALRLRAARRLRGRTDRGARGLVRVALPVLEGALERAVALAAAMDARGYGRTARVPASVRRATSALTLGGLLGVCAGSYGLLAAEGAGFGLPLLIAGVLCALAGLHLGGRRAARSRYRPDRWGARAWLVAGSGAAVAVALIASASGDPGALAPPVVPPTPPELPPLPALAVLIGLLPAAVAPAPPSGIPDPAAGRDRRRVGTPPGRGEPAPSSADGPGSPASSSHNPPPPQESRDDPL